jgi:hypothetical protein
LWLLTPPDFEVYPLDSDDREMPIWRGESHLYEINRSVHVGAQGLHGYRVEVGADSDHAHELAFDGPLLAGGEAEAGKVTIFAGVPHLRLRSGLQSRVPQVGSVFWRLWGASIWRDWVSEALDAEHDHGLVEVVWRDPKSRASLDRQRIVVVPAGAKITAQPMGEQGVAYALVNLDSWALEATSDRVAAVASPDGLEVVFNSRPLRRLALILSSNQVRLAILAPAPVAGGGFCSADGGLLDNGARVMLDELRGAVAFSAGLERLHLRGPYGSESHFTFNGELPLWAASEEIVRLLSASSGLDDVVTLELGLGGRRLKVGRYAATLMITSEGGISVVPDLAAAPTRRLDWLSVTTAQHRVLSDGFWADRLPHDLQGPGIIMARQAGRVVGRPTLAVGGTLPVEGLGGLQRATLISRGGQRRGVVSERLDTLNEDTVEAAADRDFLLAMITSLNGAPPAAIDALAMLPDHPTALASLAAAAETKDELGKVWLLERELPFLWAAVPLELWIGAFATRHKKLERLLTEHGFGAVDAAGLAGSTVASAVDALAGLDPMLRAGLALVVGATTSGNASLTLKDGVQDRLRRTAENFEGLGVLAAPLCSSRVATSCFRRPGSALVEQLPIFPFDDSFQEGLDAPCAVALAAAARLNAPRRIVLDAEQMRRARDARAREPQSFADIYTAALKLLARGAPLVL